MLEKSNTYKPQLKVLFVTALRATAKEDLFRSSTSTWELYLENNTFNERVLSNFVILASGYYSREEIEEWFNITFFSDEKRLNDSLWPSDKK